MHGIVNRTMHNFLVSVYISIKEDGNTNIALENLPLEVTNKKFGEKEALFSFFDRSKI